jgi:hypothetical protein
MSQTTTSKTTVIEHRRATGQYDMQYTEAIVEHPTLGRLYVTEAYGGEQSLAGGCYRWRHGAAYRLQPSDTLQSLDQRPAADDYPNTIMTSMVMCRDDSRPLLLDVDVARLAKQAGL